MNPENIICAKCNKVIRTKSFLTCSRCHLNYDLKCSNREKLYYLMDKERKEKWVCIQCSCNTRKTLLSKKCTVKNNTKYLIKSNSTPIVKSPPKIIENPQTRTLKTQPTSPVLMNSPKHDNITYRIKQQKINISTSNTFDSLQTEFNESDMEIMSVDTPQKRNRSCPEIIVKSHLDYEALQNELENLQQKYNSAEQQIEILLSENSSLKQEIEDYRSKICNLTSVCQNTQNKEQIAVNKNIPGPKKREKKINGRLTNHHNSELDANIDGSSSSTILRRDRSRINIPDNTSDIKQQKQNASDTVSTRQNTGVNLPKKRKLSIFSTNTKNKILKLVLNIFQDKYQLCHYITPHKGILDLLDTVDEKIKTFTKEDYCVLMIGEKDFEASQNYGELVKKIRDRVSAFTHTNIIICLPTFKCGKLSELFNRRIETFNRMLYFDTEKYEHAFVMDSNLHLSYDHTMFNGRIGSINNNGMRNIMCNLNNLIEDVCYYYCVEEVNESDQSAISEQNNFFRL